MASLVRSPAWMFEWLGLEPSIGRNRRRQSEMSVVNAPEPPVADDEVVGFPTGDSQVAECCSMQD